MPDLPDMWAWASSLETSPAFLIAVPIAIALVLATIVDLVEAHLAQRLSVSDEDATGLAHRHMSDEIRLSRIPARSNARPRDLG